LITQLLLSGQFTKFEQVGGGPSLYGSVSCWLGRKDFIDDVATQKVAFRQAWIVELTNLVHAQPPHQPPRSGVGNDSEAYHALQPEPPEGEVKRSFGRLSGEAPSLPARR
jgi:hypothetical protein